MFKEKMGNEGGFNETKEDDVEKETKERLRRLFAVMGEMYDGFKEAVDNTEDKDWYFKTDKIFTPERVKKLYDEVDEISELALECDRKDIRNMLASLRTSLFTVNDIYEKNLFDDLEKHSKYNDLSNIMQSMRVLVGAREFFTKEREVESGD